MLDVKRLVILDAVARNGSFTAAGEALNYTQSAISQHIAALERETRTVLVGRSGRRVWLTDAGAALVEHTRIVLSALSDAEAHLAAMAGLNTGTVRLAAFPSAGASLIPHAAATFRAANPDIELVLTAVEPGHVLDGLRTGEYDLAVSLADADAAGRARGAFARLRLLRDPFYAVLPQDHRLAGRRRVRLAELASDTWIATSPGGHPDADTLARVCANAGFTPRIAFHINDYHAVQGFIAVGAGVAIIPRLALTAVRADVAVLPLSPPVRRDVEIVTIASRRTSPAANALIDALRAAAPDVVNKLVRALD